MPKPSTSASAADPNNHSSAALLVNRISDCAQIWRVSVIPGSLKDQLH
jgi:hypothetical protein